LKSKVVSHDKGESLKLWLGELELAEHSDGAETITRKEPAEAVQAAASLPRMGSLASTRLSAVLLTICRF